MDTQFSAGPQALGYLHQARYSLLALLSDDRPDASLVIEGLDDIEVTGESQIALSQLKHHITEETISDYSEELWKTLRVWSESLSQNYWRPEEVSLNLITTAVAKKDSIAALLCSDTKKRNEDSALEKILEVSSKSTNAKLILAFNAFKALRPVQQKRLIEVITVIDNSKDIGDTVQLIKKKLRLTTDPEFIDYLYERLEGWWFDKVVKHLLGASKQPITQLDLDQKILSIADQFKRDSLPIDFHASEPYEDYFEKIDNRIFVEQLKHLKVNARRLRNAVLDYYRAFEQRSRWAREELYIDDELQSYENRLEREWSRYIAMMEDNFGIVDNDQVERI